MIKMHFDLSELTKLSDDMLAAAKEKFPRKTKAFMGRAGNRMRAKARAAYKADIKHSKTGNLVRGLSRGRPYIYGKDEYSVRVINKAPHAHLFEHGHVKWVHPPGAKHAVKKMENGKEAMVKGRHTMAHTEKAFQEEYEGMVDEFVDQLLQEGEIL